MKIKLTRPMRANEIKEITNATLNIPGDTRIDFIATHSDEVSEGTLFLSLQGEKTHGDVFLPRVSQNGGYMMSERSAEGCITVSSVTEALFALAKNHLGELRRLKHTVGITGSVGKTTTKEILRVLTASRFCTYANEGNQNSEIGLPLTILSAGEQTECLILEMGMNHAGEIARLSRLCMPTLGIITNIGYAHIGNLGSRESIARAKREILCAMKEEGCLLIPADEPLLSDISQAKTVGLFTRAKDYCVQSDADGRYALFKGENRLLDFNEGMKDRGMLSAAAFAAAAATELGIEKDALQKDIFRFKNNSFRQKTHYIGKAEILFDAYNASYESVLCAIDTLRSAPQSERALLLGDMLELGDYTETLHRKIGEKIAKEKNEISHLFLFGPACRFVFDAALRAGYPTQRIHYNGDADSPKKTADAIFPLCQRDMRLTVKGARGMQMERILNILIKNAGGEYYAG